MKSTISKYILLVVLSYFLLSCKTKKRDLETNGVYQSSRIDDYWYYLRFYSDSTVISVSSTGKPKDIKGWFTKNKEENSRGKYYIKNDSIFFDIESEAGVVKYQGIILNKKIIFKSESLINNYKSEEVYFFKK